MAARQELKVKILNQQGVIFDGDCRALLVPTAKETVAILPQHTPLIALLTSGMVSVITANGRKDLSHISHGIIYVGQNEASVLINA